MSPVWPNISTPCFNALNSTVKDCPGLLGDVSVNNDRLRSDQLTALCTTACQSGLKTSRQTILKGCTGPSDVIHFYDGNVYPATYIVDRYIFTYGLSCRRAAVTGHFCDDLFMAWLNQSELTPDQDCSDCLLGIQQIQLNSPFGYDADFASDFQSMTSSCSKSQYQFTSPSAYTLATATSSPTPGASPPMPPTCATPYTVQAGDTCNSISLALNVSTYSLVNAGGLLPDCSNLVSNISLCLPSPCSLYMVQKNDTCTSILSTSGLGVSAAQFLAWNPNINGLCGNLYDLRDTQLCISPPGGNLPNITVTTPLAISIPSSPVPKPTNAPGESSHDVGGGTPWQVVTHARRCRCNKDFLCRISTF
ncbi:hypothetical protein ANO14919_113410 [Xylariales sp. No.14919]|nr:hypothetical protein ANO14919_113410 [Xylariales sp. No.14919]